MADIYLNPSLEYLKSDPRKCYQKSRQKTNRLQLLKRICLIASIVFPIIALIITTALWGIIPASLAIGCVGLTIAISIPPIIGLVALLYILRSNSPLNRRVLQEGNVIFIQLSDAKRVPLPLPPEVSWTEHSSQEEKFLKMRYFNCSQNYYAYFDSLRRSFIKSQRPPSQGQYQQLLRLLQHKMTLVTLYRLIQGQKPISVKETALSFKDWCQSNYPQEKSRSIYNQDLEDQYWTRAQQKTTHQYSSCPYVEIVFGQSQSPFCSCSNGQEISIQDMLQLTSAALAQRMSQ